jgi:hypothetical protein
MAQASPGTIQGMKTGGISPGISKIPDGEKDVQLDCGLFQQPARSFGVLLPFESARFPDKITRFPDKIRCEGRTQFFRAQVWRISLPVGGNSPY